MSFTINFTGAKDFTPFEGGSDKFPYEGLTYGTITKVEESTSGSGNQTLVVSCVCDEEAGGAKGKKVRKWIPVTGTRKDGKPNVLGLLELLVSVYSHGTKTADEAIAKSRSLEAQQMSSDDMITALTGKTVYFEVKDSEYENKQGVKVNSTSLENFCAKQRFVEQSALGNHHVVRAGAPAPSTTTSAPAPSQNGQATQSTQSTKSALSALGI